VNLTFKPLEQDQAETISKWHYDGDYSFYDQEADQEDLEEFLDPQSREKTATMVYMKTTI
jgi:ribosomal-protein-alanine N-acetyltransferase